jgi:bacterioferritin-associated ferredoxin
MSSTAAKLPNLDHIEIDVALKARDSLSLSLDVDDGSIIQSHLRGRGCSELLKLLTEWRPKIKGQLQDLELPKGESHAAMMMRELILKAQGKWNFPYKEDEVCHCRAVPTSVVDGAILGGCKTSTEVSRETSASTSCGTCRPDVEAILRYRQGKF